MQLYDNDHRMQPSEPKLKIYYWDCYFLIQGEYGPIPAHSHNCIQMFLDISGSHRIFIGEKILSEPLIVVDQSVNHSVETVGSGNSFTLLIDGDSVVANHLQHSGLSEIGYLTQPTVRLELKTGTSIPELVNAILEEHFGESGCDACEADDPRIVAVKEIINQDEFKKTPLRFLAKQVNLSPGRLAHLFKEEVGVPLRKYLLWKRLIVALKNVLAGDNLTQAAHSAGFADSAHLSRTFKITFGISPSWILQHSQFVQFTEV